MATKITTTDKDKIIASTLAQINKSLGNGDTVSRIGDLGDGMKIKKISTGSLAVDMAIGGGFAVGRLSMLVGKTSSGKTTLALTAIAEVQKEKREQGEKAYILFVDAENALDVDYAASLGVDVDELYIIQPSSGEAGFEAAEMFIASGVADLVVIDSVAAMTPMALLETKTGEEPRIGALARLITQGVSKIYKTANKYSTTVIVINQFKPYVSTNRYAAQGNTVFGQWYIPGGEALPFFCSQILKISRNGQVKDGDKVLSNVISMECIKNKIAPPYRKCEFFITFGKGVDKVQEIIGIGEAVGIVEKNGRYYKVSEEYCDESEKINGRQNFYDWLEERPELVAKLRNIIFEKIKDMKSIKVVADKSEDEGETTNLVMDDDNTEGNDA